MLIALQLMQLLLFFRMSSPTLMLDSTWASLDVSMHTVLLRSGWFWVMAASLFRLGLRYEKYQFIKSTRYKKYEFSAVAAVICLQDQHCCRRLVGDGLPEALAKRALTHSAAGFLAAGRCP